MYTYACITMQHIPQVSALQADAHDAVMYMYLCSCASIGRGESAKCPGEALVQVRVAIRIQQAQKNNGSVCNATCSFVYCDEYIDAERHCHSPKT